MSRALIVVGHEFTSSEKGDDYRNYLRQKVGIKHANVISAWNKTSDQLLSLVAAHAFMAGRKPFLLAYVGHGAKEGWAYGKYDTKTWLTLPYAQIAQALGVNRKGPTLVVNDCCYADGMVDAIIRHIQLDDDIGVISASAQDGFAYGLMSSNVLTSWREGQPYVPRVQSGGRGRKRTQEKRWGARLDDHFFPKP